MNEPMPLIEPTEAVIVLDNVSKRFGNFQALKTCSLSVQKGQKIVLCGPSGSGKSTLIRCINRLEHHDSGRIVVDGIELAQNIPADTTTQHETGMVFQQFNLFPHLTVVENLMLAPRLVRKMPKPQAHDLAMHYLAKVRIPEQAGKFPIQLSGGQQQRVAIARALCMQPRIMLFDEPTSALDPEMIKEVLDVMTDLARDGMTMIVVTHEMGFARSIADLVVFMDAGEIVEQAPPAEFFGAARNPRTQAFLQQILPH
jgi:ABC-type polar amino acid transport system ATPase subunit